MKYKNNKIKKIYINKGQENERIFIVVGKVNSQEFDVLCENDKDHIAKFFTTGKYYCDKCAYLEFLELD